MKRPHTFTAWDRFLAQVDIEAVETCWRWQGVKNRNGYGLLRLPKTPDGKRPCVAAHAFAYSEIVGEIPEGVEPDHLCRHRDCVNPWHLELVTHRENVLRGTCPAAIHARKTHCTNGHPFDSKNTRIYRGKWRVCRACEKTHNKEARARKRVA